jgi:hypothetical protein
VGYMREKIGKDLNSTPSLPISYTIFFKWYKILLLVMITNLCLKICG